MASTPHLFGTCYFTGKGYKYLHDGEIIEYWYCRVCGRNENETWRERDKRLDYEHACAPFQQAFPRCYSYKPNKKK